MRGAAPPVNAASASVRAARSSARVPRMGRLASSMPSGFNAWRSWMRAPGKSFTQCRDRLATTRSKLAGAKGSTVRRDGRRTGVAGHDGGEVAADGGDAAGLQFWRHDAAAADFQREREAARDVVEPVQQPVGRVGQNVRHGAGASRRRGHEVPAHGALVENLRHIAHWLHVRADLRRQVPVAVASAPRLEFARHEGTQA